MLMCNNQSSMWRKKPKSKKILNNAPKGILNNEQGVCHTAALPFRVKRILKQKEELWKLKYFTMSKYNLQEIL
jgi:hypothetical protein